MEGEDDAGDHSQAVADFCNITGALPHVAEHYLSACGFDVNRYCCCFGVVPLMSGEADSRRLWHARPCVAVLAAWLHSPPVVVVLMLSDAILVCVQGN